MKIFNKIVLSAAGPLLLLTAIALSTPAAATDLNQAVKLCDANPNCALLPPTNAQGMEMTVKTPGGGTHIISCPKTGQCTVDLKTPAGGKSATGKAGNVARVLAGSAKTGAAADKKKTGMQINDRKPPAATAAGNSNTKTGGGNKKH